MYRRLMRDEHLSQNVLRYTSSRRNQTSSGLSLQLSHAWTNNILEYPYNRLYHQHECLQRLDLIGRKQHMVE